MKKGDTSKKKFKAKPKFSKKNFSKKQKLILSFVISFIFLSIIFVSYFIRSGNTSDLIIPNYSLRQNYSSNDNDIEDNTPTNIIPPKIDPFNSNKKVGYDKPVLVENLSEYNNDTDIFELSDGVFYSLNLWNEGTCYNGSKDNSFTDSCNGNLLKEYYIENESCISKEFDCTNILMTFFPGTKNIDAGCYKNACGGKVYGVDYAKESYCQDADSNSIYRDICLNNTHLKEYKWGVSGGCEFETINCQNYGYDVCSNGKCVNEVYESCESVCSKQGYTFFPEDYLTESECNLWLEASQTKIGGGVSFSDYIIISDTKGCCCANALPEDICMKEGYTNGVFQPDDGECENWINNNHYENLEWEFIKFGGNVEDGSCCYFESYNEDNQNYLLKSKCFVNRTKTFEDYCFSNDELIEVILLDTIYNVSEGCLYDKISCSEEFGIGSYCSNGACILPEPIIAIDSDNRKDTSIKGICSYNNGTFYEDSCYGRTSPYTYIKEWFVDSNTNLCNSEIIYCGDNYRCSDGACIFGRG